MVFKVNNTDYSDKVLMDTYNVNRIDVYTEWEDANGTTHRDIYRKKIQGEFDMQIAKMSDYTAFVSDIQNNTTNGGFVPCRVCVNNYDEENVLANLFIDYTPIKTMNNNFTKGYMSFTVRIEER